MRGGNMRRRAWLFSLVVFVFFLHIILVSAAGAITRIMPLGDSITQGAASGEPDEDLQAGYRLVLWDLLADAGYDVDFVGNLNSGSDILDFDPHHEGHPGWRDDEIAANIYAWLELYPADIILLHIGTNGLDPSPDDVEEILDEIDSYETDYSTEITVILARIINRLDHSCPDGSTTTTFNDNVEAMALARIPVDKITIVDMECGAGIDYRHKNNGGDMEDNLHPYQYGTGYDKMADVWFDALKQILPDPPNNSNSNGNSGGGSSCFITSLSYGSPMEPHGKVRRELRDEFGMGRWNQLSLGGISLLALPKGSAATLALMVTMVVFISIWVAIVLRRRQACHPLRSRIWHIICRINLIKRAALGSSNSK